MSQPKDWRPLELGQVVDFQEGLVSPLKTPFREMVHVGADNIRSGGDLVPELRTCAQLGLTSGKYPFRAGAIIYSKIRPNLNKVCRVNFAGVCSADAYPLYPKTTIVDPGFLVWAMRSDEFVRSVVETSMRTGMPKVNRGDLARIPLLLPSYREQHQITKILDSWAIALEKLDALLVAKACRKQALMQQLLTGKRRTGGKPWPRVLLADVAEEVTRRNGTTLARSHLYGVTKAEGMVPMRENVQGATTDRCKLVQPGWFAYNPMRLNIGSIARWEGNDPVMVSPDYVVFRAREERLLSDYLNHVRRAALWTDFVGASGNGSVRVRIWFDDLGRLKLPLPPLAEQRAIAAILDAADAELRLLRRQREALDRQKCGLMQQLLTGKRRVNV